MVQEIRLGESPYQFASLILERVNGQVALAGGVLTFYFGGRFRPTELKKPYVFEGASAEIHIEGRERRQVIVTPRIFSGPLAVEVQTEEKYWHVHFPLPLSFQELERIESLRDGEPPSFLFLVEAPVEQDGKKKLWKGQDFIRLSRDEWVAAVSQMGAWRTLILELNVPDSTGTTSIGAVRTHLETALARRAHGDFRGTVSACREALEALRNLLPPPSRQQRPADPRQFNKEERLRDLLDETMSVSHLAHHSDPVCDQTEWGRLDANSMLAMTSALVEALVGKR